MHLRDGGEQLLRLRVVLHAQAHVGGAQPPLHAVSAGHPHRPLEVLKRLLHVVLRVGRVPQP
jgi:hypothetical protein